MSCDTTSESVILSISISSLPKPRAASEMLQSIFIFSQRLIADQNLWIVMLISLSTRAILAPISLALSMAASISAPGLTPISEPICFWIYARSHCTRTR